MSLNTIFVVAIASSYVLTFFVARPLVRRLAAWWAA